MTGHLARLAGLPTPAGLRDGPIYLDYNATTPADPRVVEAMLPYLTTHFGNPSSGHRHAGQPRRALATARQQVARLIGAAADEIVFTGSGSEADTLAIHGTVMAHRRPAEVQVITRAHRASSGAGGLPRQSARRTAAIRVRREPVLVTDCDSIRGPAPRLANRSG